MISEESNVVDRLLMPYHEMCEAFVTQASALVNDRLSQTDALQHLVQEIA